MISKTISNRSEEFMNNAILQNDTPLDALPSLVIAGDKNPWRMQIGLEKMVHISE